MSRFIYSSLVAVSAAALVLSSPLSTNSQNAVPLRTPFIAPIVQTTEAHETINNSYIVVFKQGVSPSVLDNHFNFLQQAVNFDPIADELDSGLRHVYDDVLKGYAGKFSSGVLDQIRRMPEVDWVEKDQIVRTQEVQKGAPWGLARLSHRPRLTLGTFRRYEFNEHGGEGVDVYVIDTGINIDHVEFEGRAIWGQTIPQNDYDEDGNGHGSHCAGTIAGKTYGVAKQANVIAVKVLGSNGSGSMSDVISGVVWAAKQAKAKAAKAVAEFRATGKTSHKGSVANMSLGGGKAPALDLAVNNAVKAGMHFAVAAGNDNKDACDYSPAAAELAVTVGASTLRDERAYFSNHGACVDVFAPGLDIKSTYKGDRHAVATLSGTSMASPHVAGLMAYYLSIYPHKTFNPKFETFVPHLSAHHPHTSQSYSTASSVYAVVYSALPRFMTAFLPPPQLVDYLNDEYAPVPVPSISTTQMKVAVIGLATEGALSDLPAKTVNLLIFNNATASI